MCTEEPTMTTTLTVPRAQVPTRFRFASGEWSTS